MWGSIVDREHSSLLQKAEILWIASTARSYRKRPRRFDKSHRNKKMDTHIYDAIVIGAGGMGSATAYHLAKSGANVLVLEQFQRGTHLRQFTRSNPHHPFFFTIKPSTLN